MEVPFIKGKTVSNHEIVELFKCSLQAGMNRAHETNTLVLISNHKADTPYEDRWDGDIFYYTGMGRRGDQSLTNAQNKTLAESRGNGVGVFLFETFNLGEYIYRGQVRLKGDPFTELQLDDDKVERKVYVFPLEIIDGNAPVDIEEIIKIEQNKLKYAQTLADDVVKDRALASKDKVSKRKAITEHYIRNVYVAEYARRRANGVCQLCEEPAPFKDREGNPFLEAHHITWIAHGGPDVIENTVALCPNCHSKMHVLNLEEDVNKLRLLVQ